MQLSIICSRPSWWKLLPSSTQPESVDDWQSTLTISDQRGGVSSPFPPIKAAETYRMFSEATHLLHAFNQWETGRVRGREGQVDNHQTWNHFNFQNKLLLFMHIHHLLIWMKLLTTLIFRPRQLYPWLERVNGGDRQSMKPLSHQGVSGLKESFIEFITC